MSAIKAEFRKHLPSSDIHFITQALAGDSPSETEALFYLLTDPETVDSVLDQPALFDYVLSSCETLSLSPRLYFYLLTRHSLKQSGLDSPAIADYVSGVLESFLESGFHPHCCKGVFYIVDWLNQVESSPEGKRYELYVMAGHQLLFLTGIFPHFIEKRSRRRGAPGLGFYENAGRSSFRMAADHPLSRRGEKSGLYGQLAETLPDIRLALNDLSSRLIFLEHS